MDFDWNTVKSIFIYPSFSITSNAPVTTVENYLRDSGKYLPDFESIIDNTPHAYTEEQREEIYKLILFLKRLISSEDPLSTGLELIEGKFAQHDISGNVSIISSSAASASSEEVQQLVDTPRRIISEGCEVPEYNLAVLREAISKNSNKPPQQEDLARFEAAAKSSPEPASPVQPPAAPAVAATQPQAPAAAPTPAPAPTQSSSQTQQQQQAPPSNMAASTDSADGGLQDNSVLVIGGSGELRDRNGIDHRLLAEKFKQYVPKSGGVCVRAEWRYAEVEGPDKNYHWRGIARYNEEGEPVVGWLAPDALDTNWQEALKDYVTAIGQNIKHFVEKDPEGKLRPKPAQILAPFPNRLVVYYHVIFDTQFITEQASSKALASDPNIRAKGHTPSVAPTRNGASAVSFAQGSPNPRDDDAAQVANDRNVATGAQVGEMAKVFETFADTIVKAVKQSPSTASPAQVNNNNRRPFATTSAMGGIFSGCTSLREYAERANNCLTHVNGNQQREVEITKALLELGKQSWGLTESSKNKEMVKYFLSSATTAIMFASSFENFDENDESDDREHAEFMFKLMEQQFDKTLVLLQAKADSWRNPEFNYNGFKNVFELDQHTPHSAAAQNSTMAPRRKGGFNGFKKKGGGGNNNNNNNRNKNNNNNNNNNRSSGGNNNTSSGNASAGAH